MRAFFVLKFAGVGFSSYLCRCNEDATAIAVGNLTRGICGGASRWGQDLTRKSQATLRQCQTPVRGDAAEERPLWKREHSERRCGRRETPVEARAQREAMRQKRDSGWMGLRRGSQKPRGESSLAGIIGLEDLHALLEEGVLVVLDEGSADAEAFLFGAAGDQADG